MWPTNTNQSSGNDRYDERAARGERVYVAPHDIKDWGGSPKRSRTAPVASTVTFTRSTVSGEYAATVMSGTSVASDWRDGDGNRAEEVVTMPVKVAIAAPDLYAACVEAALLIGDTQTPGLNLAVSKLRAAIAKAEGR